MLRIRYLEDLEEKFQNLNEGLLAELHEMIQPYILRRIKADVLRLPPKVSHLMMPLLIYVRYRADGWAGGDYRPYLIDANPKTHISRRVGEERRVDTSHLTAAKEEG